MRRSERGQTLVEAALVMLIFCALVLGVVDFGQAMFSHQALTERARAALRWGSLHPEAGPDAVRNMVLFGVPEGSAAPGYLGLTADNVHVEFRAGDVETLHVEVVRFHLPLFAPWWPANVTNARPVSMTAPVVTRSVSYSR
jgi:hypothetical protein